MSSPGSAAPRPLAGRMAGIAPFHVMELLARAQALEAAGRSIIHMEVGEPDFTTCEPILRAGQRALAEGRTRYTVTAGITPLREAIAGHYQSRFGVTLAPERIFVTPGASGALQLATAVLLNPGDRVLLSDPGYPCNRHFVRLVEAEPVGIPVGPERHYQLDAELVARHWDDRTRAVLLATPSNPTGTIVARPALEAISALVTARGGRLIVDEIYQGLVYDHAPYTALEVDDGAMVVNSFSKYFGMTGWRIGWLAVPHAYRRDIEKLAQNLFISAPTVAQYAALAAFGADALEICEARREAFRERRDFLLPALRELGFGIPLVPEGAFYLYADCSAFTDDSYRFCFELLDRAGVAITPGIDFGARQAARHVRIAYTNSLENLRIAVDRLAVALAPVREV